MDQSLLDDEITVLFEKCDNLYLRCLETMKSLPEIVSDIQLEFITRYASDDDCDVFYDYLLFVIMNNNKKHFFVMADSIVPLLPEEGYQNYINKIECLFLRDVKCDFMIDVATFYDYLVNILDDYAIFLEFKKMKDNEDIEE